MTFAHGRWTRFGALPEADRMTAFDAVLGAVQHLPDGQRSEPLTELAVVSKKLPEADRKAAFDAVLDAVQHLPDGHRSNPLERLAHSIDALPEADRMTAFDGVLSAVQHLPDGQRDAPVEALQNVIRTDLPDPSQRRLALTAFEQARAAWQG
jgi:hypothetical protein